MYFISLQGSHIRSRHTQSSYGQEVSSTVTWEPTPDGPSVFAMRHFANLGYDELETKKSPQIKPLFCSAKVSEMWPVTVLFFATFIAVTKLVIMGLAERGDRV